MRNGRHNVTIRNGKLHCTCGYFYLMDKCNHVHKVQSIRRRRGLGAFIASLRKTAA